MPPDFGKADQLVTLKAVEPPGQARSDFDIFIEVARRLGFEDRDGAPLIRFSDPRDAFEGGTRRRGRITSPWTWVEVLSSRGDWEGPAMVVDTVRPGELFIPFHFGKGRQAANQHTTYARDPVSKQPQFKSSPVMLRRLSFANPEPWLVERQRDLAGMDSRPYAAREIR